MRICAGIAAILGHNYTCWLYFKGGKGIATSAGVLVALVPLPLLIILGSLDRGLRVEPLRVAGLDLRRLCPALRRLGWSGKARTIILVTAALAALAIYKHKANIQRLINGTENRIGAKKPLPSDAPKPTA